MSTNDAIKYRLKAGHENMDVNAIHSFLANESYWAKNIPIEAVKSALKNSYCVGIFDGNRQIAFARLITDYSTFAYLADVYVLAEFRKNGISKQMMNHIMSLNWVMNLRRFMLATLDAHELYKTYGFNIPKYPERLMEISNPDIYAK